MKKYTLSIGLRDGHIPGHPQIIPTFLAKSIVANTMISRFGGATIIPALGVYTHDNGRKVRENTLVVYLYDADRKAVLDTCEYLARRLRQESIAFECAEIESDFIRA